MEFSYLNFCCRYIAEISDNPNKLSFISSHGAACFSSIFRVKVNTLTILCYRQPNNKNWNNYCPFNPYEIRKILRYLQTIICFKSEFTITEDEYRITFSNLDTLSFIERKILYTLSRIFFEYPINAVGYDALQLKKYPKFKNKSYWELLDLVTKSFPNIHHGHWFHSNYCTYNLKGLHQTIKRVGNSVESRVQDILNPNELSADCTWINKIKNDKAITDEDSFNMRLEVYKKNLKHVKTIKL